MPEGLAYRNGELLDAAELGARHLDSGLLIGDGLFETLRVENGVALDIEAHIDRLQSGLAFLELVLAMSPEALIQGLRAVADGAARPVARLRITAASSNGTASTAVMITAAPYTPPPAAVDVRTEDRLRVFSSDALRGVKSVSSQRQALVARRATPAFEALMLNEHGRIAEGTRSNLVVALGDAVVTPPLSEGCLPGTVRRRLVETGAVRERPVELSDLANAHGVALTNSLIGVLAVARVDAMTFAGNELASELDSVWRSRIAG